MSLESGPRAEDAELGADSVRAGELAGVGDGFWSELAEQTAAEAGDAARAAADSEKAREKVQDSASTTEAYEAAVKKAFGGKMGMADVGLPALLFLIIYTATKELTPALWGSVGVAVLLAVVRLVRRETLQHAISGLFGVVVCAVFAKWTGRPENYYLPGLLTNLGYGLACLISALVRWPLVGLMLGPITGEMVTWRQVPGRQKAFTQATLLLAALFFLRLVVQVPLWVSHQTTALGIARLVMGYPLYLPALYVCWQMIKAAPPPIKVQPLGSRGESTPDAESAEA